jgi:hypothetical protein
MPILCAYAYSSLVSVNRDLLFAQFAPITNGRDYTDNRNRCKTRGYIKGLIDLITNTLMH